MFGMGWQEILLVLAIAILVIGPDQLPQVAKGLGKLMAQFRRATSDLRNAVNEEVHQYQEMDEIKSFSSDLQSEVRSFGTSAQEYLDREIEKGEKELAGEDAEEKPAPQVDPIPTEDYGPVLTSSEETPPDGAQADATVTEDAPGDTQVEEETLGKSSRKETA